MLEVAGVEADDVIATLATRAAEPGHRRRRRHRRPRLVPARARPAHQGALQQARRLRLRALRRGRHRRAHRRHPAQYLDYAALRGDTSDNLPGVPGIGEKTAAKLITTYGTLEGIFEHLDELPPKQRQNLGEARERVFQNREMSRLVLDVDSTSTPATCARARWTASRCACCSTSSSSARCCRGCSRRSARSRPRREAETLEVDVEVVRDAPRRSGSSREIGKRASATRSSRAGRARRSQRAPRRRARDAAIARGTSTASCSPTPRCRRARRAARRRRSAARRAPGQGADARARPSTSASLDHDTAVMAYLLDPGEGKYELEELALRYLSLELRSPDREEGTLDLDGDAGIERDRPPRRRRAAPRRRARRGRRSARELTDLYERFERPLVRVLAQDGGRRRPHRPRVPRRAAHRALRAVRRPRGADPHARGRAVQRQLHAAAAARSCSRSSGSHR